jgi:hypothetical protein
MDARLRGIKEPVKDSQKLTHEQVREDETNRILTLLETAQDAWKRMFERMYEVLQSENGE